MCLWEAGCFAWCGREERCDRFSKADLSGERSVFKTKQSRWVGLIAAFVLSGCAAYAPPIQEMSDARQSIRAAVDAGASHYFPTLMDRVNVQIAEAERQLAASDYHAAAQQALAAKTEAVRIRVMALALASTIALVAEADPLAASLKDTQVVLRRALEAASRGDDATAMVLATQVQEEASEMIYNGHKH